MSELAVVTRRSIARDAGWLRAARWARWLAWASLVWMTAEGAIGLWAGFFAGSIALVGWALSSAVEGLASVIVIWRFTGSRQLSETSERKAQKAGAKPAPANKKLNGKHFKGKVSGRGRV